MVYHRVVQPIAGRYELLELIGSGGFASVYRARDLAENKPVAVKVIPTDGASSELADRFRHEALALSRLGSPFVARVFDFGRDEAVGLYLVMELIVGVPLDVPGLGRALGEAEVAVAARSLLSGLADAHAHGLVHRDVKPGNVLAPGGLAGLDALKVLDFGIARAERRREILEAIGSADTREGHMVGTPAYMAPEQIALGEVGPTADVYSAGLVLFELLDRGALFLGGTQREELMRRMSQEPDLRARVPSPLGAVLSKMLARDPDARFRDAQDALLAFAELGGESPSGAKKRADDTIAHAKTQVGSRVSAAPPSRRSLPHTPRKQELSQRVWALDQNPRDALRDTLLAMDLAMMDALARRERGSATGEIARAAACALRLELNAAAALLEPLLADHPIARGVAITLVAPRAPTPIAARLDVDPNDTWIPEVDPALASALSFCAVALGAHEVAQRNAARCRLAAEHADGPPRAEVARTIAGVAAAIGGAEATDRWLVDARRVQAELPATMPLEDVTRSLAVGILAFRADEHLAREQMERAIRISFEVGSTLFEARALVNWSAVMLSAKSDQGLLGLARATALLAGRDATSLEQMAEHNMGAGLMVAGRFGAAVAHLERAVRLARAERRDEYTALAAANLAFARSTQPDDDAFARALGELSSADFERASARAKSFVKTVRSIYALRRLDADAAQREIDEARALGSEAGLPGTDAWLMAEAIGLVVSSARGEPLDLLARAAEIEHVATERGFASFFWLELMTQALTHVPDETLRNALLGPMARLSVLLGPAGKR